MRKIIAKRFLGLDRPSRASTGLELVAGHVVYVTIEPLPVEFAALDARRFAHGVRGSGEPACASRLASTAAGRAALRIGTICRDLLSASGLPQPDEGGVQVSANVTTKHA
jgi:hypothetical protein